MKPTSTYVMSKALKCQLALAKFKDAHQKGAWKRTVIAADVYADSVERVINLGGQV